MLDKTQVAGYLGVRVRRVDELRRGDVTFPPPRLLSPGTARWRRADLDRWIEGLRSGWCTTGGRREGAFRRAPAQESGVLSQDPKHETTRMVHEALATSRQGPPSPRLAQGPEGDPTRP